MLQDRCPSTIRNYEVRLVLVVPYNMYFFGESLQDYSSIQDFEADFLCSSIQNFEADFPQKVSLKILNLED